MLESNKYREFLIKQITQSKTLKILVYDKIKQEVEISSK